MRRRPARTRRATHLAHQSPSLCSSMASPLPSGNHWLLTLRSSTPRWMPWRRTWRSAHPRGQLRIATHSGHDIMRDEPSLVVQAVKDVWTATQTGPGRSRSHREGDSSEPSCPQAQSPQAVRIVTPTPLRSARLHQGPCHCSRGATARPQPPHPDCPPLAASGFH